jgi:hypothetical protein
VGEGSSGGFPSPCPLPGEGEIRTCPSFHPSPCRGWPIFVTPTRPTSRPFRSAITSPIRRAYLASSTPFGFPQAAIRQSARRAAARMKALFSSPTASP